MLEKSFTTELHPNLLVIFEIWSCFVSGLAWTVILLFVLPLVARMTGMHDHVQLFYWLR
jgi:membrane-associated HD superfamily phosphohydrolase